MINLQQMISNFKQNPAQFLKQNFNVQIPENLTDSGDIIQYFLNTGRFTQQQVNNAMQMRNHPMFKGKF